MIIDEKTVDHLANLAKLEFNKEDKLEIISDLNKMLSFVETLNELNTDNIDPLIHISDEVNNLREDIPVDGVSQTAGLKNAPDKDSYYFKVPKVIDNS
ncbi:MAG: aspartyl-tRNA(Asn)/glutamyl-tRNA(Gln) amidotransferase subunit C [Patiriisocius sp.]|jgi:aspartyl-tRNA(Asn)/glutamyl-tRNA(Gln) amidotransferase subunit C